MTGREGPVVAYARGVQSSSSRVRLLACVTGFASLVLAAASCVGDDAMTNSGSSPPGTDAATGTDSPSGVDALAEVAPSDGSMAASSAAPRTSATASR